MAFVSRTKKVDKNFAWKFDIKSGQDVLKSIFYLFKSLEANHRQLENNFEKIIDFLMSSIRLFNKGTMYISCIILFFTEIYYINVNNNKVISCPVYVTVRKLKARTPLSKKNQTPVGTLKFKPSKS